MTTETTEAKERRQARNRRKRDTKRLARAKGPRQLPPGTLHRLAREEKARKRKAKEAALAARKGPDATP